MSSRALGEQAAGNSAAALELQAKERLEEQARNLAEWNNESFARERRTVEVIAGYLADREEAALAQEPGTGGLLPPAVFAPGTESRELISQLAQLKDCYKWMRQVQQGDELITACYAATESGIFLVAEEGSRSPPKGFDARTRVWYRSAAAQGGTGWSDITADAAGQGEGIVCSTPYYGSDGTLLGVVGAGVLLTQMQQTVLSAEIGGTGYAFVVDGDGNLIITPSVWQAGDQTAFSMVYQEIGGREKGITTWEGMADPLYLAWYPVEELGWTVVVAMSQHEALAQARASSELIDELTAAAVGGLDRQILRLVWSFLFTALAITVASCVLAVVLARRISAPILRLSQEVAGLHAGNLDFQSSVRTGDEVQVLAETFQEMARDLGDQIGRLRQVTAERERVETELNVATQIQTGMLPCIFPAYPDRHEFDIYGMSRPAKEVGGDFYDFFLLEEECLAVVIADVSGKGVPAALFMVIAKTLIKNHFQMGLEPAQVLETVNAQLCQNNEVGLFVTAFLGMLDLRSGLFRYANAGHNPPLLFQGGHWIWLETTPGFVLGGLEGVVWKGEEIHLQKGDSLLFYTDGVTEAMNTEEELYGEERFRRTLEAHPGQEARELVQAALVDVDRFAEEATQADDITMLALRLNPEEQVSKSYRLSLEATEENLPRLINFLERCLEEAEIRPETWGNLFLAAEEVYVNIASYAYHPGMGEAHIVCRIAAGGQVTLEFMDNGVPWNPLEQPEPDVSLPAENREPGGLGIFLTRRLAKSMIYSRENGNNRLCLIFDSRKDETNE